MNISPVQEHCMEKLYTEFDRNWTRNLENMSKYLFTHMGMIRGKYKQTSIYKYESTTGVNAPEVMKTTANQEYCMDKL